MTSWSQKAEEEIKAILTHLAAQDKALQVIHEMLEDMRIDRNTASGR